MVDKEEAAVRALTGEYPEAPHHVGEWVGRARLAESALEKIVLWCDRYEADRISAKNFVRNVRRLASSGNQAHG